MSTDTPAESTERPQYAQIEATDSVSDFRANAERIDGGWRLLGRGTSEIYADRDVTVVRPMRLVPVVAGSVGGPVEGDPIEAAVWHPMRSADDWLRDQHARYHDDAGNMLGDDECAWRDCRFWDVGQHFAELLPVIAAAVRAQVAKEIAGVLRDHPELAAQLAGLLTITADMLGAAAPVAAPTEPDRDNGEYVKVFHHHEDGTEAEGAIAECVVCDSGEAHR